MGGTVTQGDVEMLWGGGTWGGGEGATAERSGGALGTQGHRGVVALGGQSGTVGRWHLWGTLRGELGSISSGHAVRLLLRRLWGRRGADGDRQSCAVTPSPTAPPNRLTWAMLTPVSASTALGSFVTTPRISAGSRPTPMSPEPPATTVTRRVPSSGCATASATWPINAAFTPQIRPTAQTPKPSGSPLPPSRPPERPHPAAQTPNAPQVPRRDPQFPRGAQIRWEMTPKNPLWDPEFPPLVQLRDPDPLPPSLLGTPCPIWDPLPHSTDPKSLNPLGIHPQGSHGDLKPPL